jgi:hypothetical protein
LKPTAERSVVVKVTLTEAEGTMLTDTADRAGIPLSIYVRAAALEKTRANQPNGPTNPTGA